MPNANAIALHDYPDDVETIRLARSPMAVDPDAGGAGQLNLLSPPHRLDRATEALAPTGLHLDESDGPVALRDEVDVSMPVAEPPRADAPTLPPEPPLRDPFSDLAECLCSR